jgi:hypothetical protein
MQPTAPYAIIETLEKVHNLHGCTRRIGCACTALSECFIANALIDKTNHFRFHVTSQDGKAGVRANLAFG